MLDFFTEALSKVELSATLGQYHDPQSNSEKALLIVKADNESLELVAALLMRFRKLIRKRDKTKKAIQFRLDEKNGNLYLYQDQNDLSEAQKKELGSFLIAVFQEKAKEEEKARMASEQRSSEGFKGKIKQLQEQRDPQPQEDPHIVAARRRRARRAKRGDTPPKASTQISPLVDKYRQKAEKEAEKDTQIRTYFNQLKYLLSKSKHKIAREGDTFVISHNTKGTFKVTYQDVKQWSADKFSQILIDNGKELDAFLQAQIQEKSNMLSQILVDNAIPKESITQSRHSITINMSEAFNREYQKAAGDPESRNRLIREVLPRYLQLANALEKTPGKSSEETRILLNSEEAGILFKESDTLVMLPTISLSNLAAADTFETLFKKALKSTADKMDIPDVSGEIAVLDDDAIEEYNDERAEKSKEKVEEERKEQASREEQERLKEEEKRLAAEQEQARLAQIEREKEQALESEALSTADAIETAPFSITTNVFSDIYLKSIAIHLRQRGFSDEANRFNNTIAPWLKGEALEDAVENESLDALRIKIAAQGEIENIKTYLEGHAHDIELALELDDNTGAHIRQGINNVQSSIKDVENPEAIFDVLDEHVSEAQQSYIAMIEMISLINENTDTVSVEALDAALEQCSATNYQELSSLYKQLDDDEAPEFNTLFAVYQSLATPDEDGEYDVGKFAEIIEVLSPHFGKSYTNDMLEALKGVGKRSDEEIAAFASKFEKNYRKLAQHAKRSITDQMRIINQAIDQPLLFDLSNTKLPPEIQQLAALEKEVYEGFGSGRGAKREQWARKVQENKGTIEILNSVQTQNVVLTIVLNCVEKGIVQDDLQFRSLMTELSRQRTVMARGDNQSKLDVLDKSISYMREIHSAFIDPSAQKQLTITLSRLQKASIWDFSKENLPVVDKTYYQAIPCIEDNNKKRLSALIESLGPGLKIAIPPPEESGIDFPESATPSDSSDPVSPASTVSDMSDVSGYMSDQSIPSTPQTPEATVSTDKGASSTSPSTPLPPETTASSDKGASATSQSLETTVSSDKGASPATPTSSDKGASLPSSSPLTFGARSKSPQQTSRKVPLVKKPPKYNDNYLRAKHVVDNVMRGYGRNEADISERLGAEYNRKRGSGWRGVFKMTRASYSKKRADQINRIAHILSTLQQDEELNTHEKGIILYGALQSIKDEIRQEHNLLNSSLNSMCSQMQRNLTELGGITLPPSAQKGYEAYLKATENKASAFRDSVSSITPTLSSSRKKA